MADFSLEDAGTHPVCGIDEAGRGPWAGPVVAGCVFVPPDAREHMNGVNDSKKLSANARERFFALITTHCAYGIGQASVAEIDRLNIRKATHLAMQRAYMSMCEAFSDIHPHMALVDGRENLNLPCAILPVIGGDAKSISIAAASILAKVTRDRVMTALHDEYPLYDWCNNAGYGVPVHAAALQSHGVTIHHRQSFKPVREILEKNLVAGNL